MLVLVRSGIGIALAPASAATLHPEGVVFRSIGSFRERPVELDAVWRGNSTNPALLRLLRDVLPQREWTTDDLVKDRRLAAAVARLQVFQRLTPQHRDRRDRTVRHGVQPVTVRCPIQ